MTEPTVIEPGLEAITHPCQGKGCFAESAFHDWPDGHWCEDCLPSQATEAREAFQAGLFSSKETQPQNLNPG